MTSGFNLWRDAQFRGKAMVHWKMRVYMKFKSIEPPFWLWPSDLVFPVCRKGVYVTSWVVVGVNKLAGDMSLTQFPAQSECLSSHWWSRCLMRKGMSWPVQWSFWGVGSRVPRDGTRWLCIHLPLLAGDTSFSLNFRCRIEFIICH